MSNHPIVHVDITSTDPKAGRQFYSELFGWSFQTYPEGNYEMFAGGEGGPGGGLPGVDNQIFNPGDTLVYVATDDIEATLAKAQQLGGRVILPKTEIPATGWFAILGDPTGGRIGLYTGQQQ